MTIYTAIIGPYEELKEPLIVTAGWRYVCFTDQIFDSEVWEIKQVASQGDPQRTARMYKILNPLGAEMWVDGSFQINCDLNQFWDKYFIAPFSLPSHPMRDCMYEEAMACIQNKRGNQRDITDQFLAYKQMKMPRHAGMVSSGVLLRDNSKRVHDWCLLWYNEMMQRSTRDQLAFAYICWRNGAIHSTFKWDYRTAQYLIFKTHYHRR